MKKLLCTTAISVMLTSFTAYAAPIEIQDINGDWVNAVPSGVTVENDTGANNNTNTVSWGTGGTSSYVFVDSAAPTLSAPNDGAPFVLGNFTHNNYTISTPFLSSVDLQVTVDFADGAVADIVTTFNFLHDETPNNGPNPDDIVTIVQPYVNEKFSINGIDYYFNLLGFSTDGGNTIDTSFYTEENQANSASLYATITTGPLSEVPEPTTMLLFGTGIAALAAVGRKRK